MIVRETSAADIEWRAFEDRALPQLTKMALARVLQLRDKFSDERRADRWQLSKSTLLAAVRGDGAAAAAAAPAAAAVAAAAADDGAAAAPAPVRGGRGRGRGGRGDARGGRAGRGGIGAARGRARGRGGGRGE